MICKHIFFLVWQGNMTPSYILQVVGEGGVVHQPATDYSGKQESVDYSSKQNSGKSGHLSVQPSLLIQADMGMREPHSLLAMYASAVERQTCDHDWYLGRNRQKANTWWIFKLWRLVSGHLFVKEWRHIMSCHFFVGEWSNIIWDMEETQISKSCCTENTEKKEKDSPLNEPALRGMVSLVK